MNIITLSAFDLSLAAVLVLLLAGLSLWLQLGITQQLLVASLRTVVQLMLIGVVLKALFENVDLVYMTLVVSIMLLLAGREVMARQTHRFVGWWGFGMGTLSMFVSTFVVTLLALTVIINTDPWYTPQYSIPLLGMLLGNTMTGIALGLEHLTQTAREQRRQIEARLMLGHSASVAISNIRRNAMRLGMIPIINSMAAAGIVSLPGMMTGQILSGTPPMEAVKYQILIMFLIAAGTGFGTVAAVLMAGRRLFDGRTRLRLDRLK
ncbi:ABC transporter permease [Sulfuriflexus sp.]|uniref:ABC transporter permease n=1 Tax=Sulfuriflexus sp. TaxID=2015443 RepID=UPI0028CEB582|nr:iron export ABC transporter permease subunit FetB [Sulfuriflexus sp.]MDT8403173.1 iron export ABC transporter permease subunit FetB [Sulfuriflexus sp.]